MSDRPGGLFERDGDLYIPDPITAGPWAATAMHGSPATALIGRLMHEWETGDAEWFLTRITVELIRPVPLAPLRVEIAPRRLGRRVHVLDGAIVTTDGVEVLIARGLRIRVEDNGIDESEVPHPPPADVPPASECPPWQRQFDARQPWQIFSEAVELRPVSGKPFEELGPTLLWMTPTVPMFTGEEIQPLDRLLMCSDWANGMANVVPFEQYRYPNADLSVAIHRLPMDESLLLDAWAHVRAGGYGMASALLSDSQGQLALTTQSLVVDRR